MSIRRLSSCVFLLLAVALLGVVAGSKLSSQAVPQAPTVISGRNVNMVSGTTLPGGDPWLQRQNEPSIAVSSRNTLHLLAGANDYRTVDMPTSEGELPGKQPTASVGDAWLGVYMSYDGGESWTSTMLPGFPQAIGSNPLKGYRAAADPVVRSGPNGLFYYSGIAFNRDTNLGVVFVARFIDDNNKENGGTIRYIDTKIIAKGTATKFLDKPWISVDQPRVPLTNITISGQTFPRHNVYVAYSSFSGTTTLLGDIMFARSTDCGTSWAAPIKISSGSYAHQGATIAIKPVIGEVLVAWRRFGVSGRTPDTIYVAQSFSRGSRFQAPVKVADLAPFDQPTTDETQSLPNTAAGPAFRTNSYPTIAVDKSGHVYLAWSQRGLGPTGDARIVLSTSHLGSNWSIPQPVANADENGLPFLGNQIMPAMTFAAGKLALVWVDQRRDVSATEYGFNQWIIDSLPYRHTMDVWAAEAETSTFPNLVWKSSQVSRYLHALLRDQFGEIVYENGQPVIFPVQFNCVNYPLFKGGHNPFNGDYIDIAASPTFRQNTWRNWIFNADDERDPVFHVAWADNRDVRPPLDGNWTVYTPPSSNQASAYISPEHPSCNPNGSGNEPGMRNQNIYTSRLTWGLDAGAPVNDKPLNLADGVARAFVVYVKNHTESLRSFRLSIATQPAGGQASFDQFGLLTSLDVNIAPYSTIARTVFIGSSDINATVTVNINETDSSGTIISDGLSSFIDINSDTSNPQMSGTQETHNPNIVNPATPNIVNWFVNPNIVNPNIVNPNIVNPNIVNPNIVNPNIVNPNIVNPNIVNPNIVNPNIVNPNIVNPNIVNPNIVNPNIVNPNIVNPNIVDADPDDVTATDVEWTVRNDGTATTSYSLKTLAKKSPPQGVYVQLLVYRVHYTPAVSGAELKAEGVEACTLKQEPHHELVLNVVNPNIVNPNIVNPNIVNPNIVNADIENATFSVAPGEEVVVDLRVLDSGEAGGSTAQNAPQMAIAAGAASAPAQALTVDEFIQSLGFAVTSHAVNSADVALGSEIPPADATDLVIGTSSLPDGVEGYSYDAPLSAFGGLGSYVWSLNAGELPPGLSVASGGAIIGMPTQRGTYQFIVRVDSGGQFDTQQYVINIDSDTAPDTLTITTMSIPSGVQGVWYGATLQAVGGVWPRSWSLASGTLPGGVSLDSGGVISGTPTMTGSFGFTARVVDRNGTIDTQAFTLVVAGETTTYLDITGVVFDEGGAPLGGVVLRGLPNTPVTAADGTYADTVPAGWSGTAIPFAAGHSFTPPSRTYTSLASSQTSENYNTPAAALSISGNVRLGATGLVGVEMNGLPGNPLTDTSGTFLVSVNYGWSGTVTPILSGYTFNPPSQLLTNITTDQSIAFTAATIVGPASKLVFTQSPNGGIGGAVWTTQPIVEIQDGSGNRITTDDSTQITISISNDPGGGSLGGIKTITAVNGAAAFADLTIDRGGFGYSLQAESDTSGITPAISDPFGIEGFAATANTMTPERSRHTATPLVLGVGAGSRDVVLVAGGVKNDAWPAKPVDIYDPDSNTFSTHSNAMLGNRTGHTATPLLDGRVLFVGGELEPYTVELFDPKTGTFTLTEETLYPHMYHCATLLQNGKVLITGNVSADQDAAELFDPQTGSFSETGPMTVGRNMHTSTLLPNGKVLIAGGRANAYGGTALLTAELYDPMAGEFTGLGDMVAGPRWNHQATLLDNGTVLITGGSATEEDNISAIYFDPAPGAEAPDGSFHFIGVMMYTHAGHRAVLLRDGTVLLIGGNVYSDGNEIYNPGTLTFRPTGPMTLDRGAGAASVLPDGRALITGGAYLGEGATVANSAEVWTPQVPFNTHIISGTVLQGGVGVGGVILVGLPGHPMTDAGGYYEGLVVDGWDGVVTPTKPGYVFNPTGYENSDVISDMPNQDYSVTQAAAARLAFIQQPTNTMVNSTITPAVTVEVQDALGNRVPTSTDTVALSLRNGGSAILNGTLSRPAVAGLATFGDLSVNAVGMGYLLRANSGSLTEVDSAIFNVAAPVPTIIQVETAADGSGVIVPTQFLTSGSVITAYAVARDAMNNFAGNVSADNWSLILKVGGVVDGDLVPFPDGTGATFTAHAIGGAQIHAAEAGLSSADSGVLTVTAAAAAGVALSGPARMGAGFVSGAFVVSVRDAFGNPVNVSQNTEFHLASTSTGNKFFSSDPAGTGRITSVTIPSGLTSAPFYYFDDALGTPNVTATWASGGGNLGSAESGINVWAVVHQILFESDREADTRQIFGMNADGTGVVALTSGPSANMHPCASPGGGRIVFASERDGNREIYVMNASGSDPVRLTTNTALDEVPVWSPDEQRVAFERGYDIYVMEHDGSAQINLTNSPAWDSFPNWSPDNTKILFSSDRTGSTQLFTMNPDGTGVAQLTTAVATIMWGSWSPDGTKIAFAGTQGTFLDIFTVNPDGTGLVQLTANAGNNYNPRWAPDGRRITFMGGRDGNPEIYVMNADGTAPTRLTNNAAEDAKPVWGASRIWYSNGTATPGGRIYSVFPDGTGRTQYPAGSAIDSSPRLSPDGTKVAFVRIFPDTAIYVMSTDGTGATLLNNSSGWVDIEPSWSPDGTKIVFTSTRGGHNREIYVMNAVGGTATQLTSGALGVDSWRPDWSPDGRTIAFSRDDEICIMNPDGSGQASLGVAGVTPRWSADGAKIVYQVGTSPLTGIYVMNADGSSPQRLTTLDGDRDPCWSPDRARIAFIRWVLSLGQVHVMNDDGTGVTQLTTNETGGAEFPSWGAQAQIIVPTVTGLEPPNGAVEVPINTDLTITFSENITKGSGTIIIRDATTSGIWESIDVLSSQVTVIGKTVVIDPPYDLHIEGEYQIEIPEGCFVDLDGNSWVGIGGFSGSHWVIHTENPEDPLGARPMREKAPSK